MCVWGGERESTTLGSSNQPGLRGSHILRIGSEPPAATSAEPSPPISRQLRALLQGCAEGECYHLNFKKSGKENAGTRVLEKYFQQHSAKKNMFALTMFNMSLPVSTSHLLIEWSHDVE